MGWCPLSGVLMLVVKGEGNSQLVIIEQFKIFKRLTKPIVWRFW